VEAKQRCERTAHSGSCSIGPGKALVPHKIVEDGGFNRERCRQQVIDLHRSESGQHAELNRDAQSANERELQDPEICRVAHAILSSL
jgi:hypothetical protein